MYEKLLDKVEFVLKFLVGLILIVMTALVSLEVVRRYFFSLTYTWSEELIRYFMIWLSFLGAPVAYRQGGLVAFEMLSNKVSKQKKEYLFSLVNFTVFIASASTAIIRQVSTSLHVSMSIPYSAIPICFSIFVLFSSQMLLGNIKRIVKKPDKGEVAG